MRCAIPVTGVIPKSAQGQVRCAIPVAGVVPISVRRPGLIPISGDGCGSDFCTEAGSDFRTLRNENRMGSARPTVPLRSPTTRSHDRFRHRNTSPDRHRAKPSHSGVRADNWRRVAQASWCSHCATTVSWAAHWPCGSLTPAQLCRLDGLLRSRVSQVHVVEMCVDLATAIRFCARFTMTTC